MRHEFEEDQEKFRLQPTDELDEPSIGGNVNELRLEKISQRVTLISIIIPVLIIIVLAFTYLDVKKRMTYTEDTGMMEFEKLSADLESRFSSLSVRQAKLEETIISFTSNYDQALAGLNIKVDKINSSLDSLEKIFLSRKDFKPIQDEMNRNISQATANIDNVAADVDQVDGQIATMTKELKAQISGIGKIITDKDNELNKIQESIKALNAKQIDEPDIDLKVKLATLKMKQDIMSQMDQIELRLKSISEKIEKLSQRTPVPTQTPSIEKNKVEPQPKPPAGKDTGLIEEQIIQP